MPQPEQVAEDPRRFYKYTTNATAQLVLEHRSLRWSSPFAYNDPFDNQFDLQLDVDAQQVTRLTLDMLWESYTGGGPPLIVPGVQPAFALLREAPQQLTRPQLEEYFKPAVEQSLARTHQLLADFHRDIRVSARSHKILCLAQTPVSVLMWAYYADGHKGAVLRFRTPPGIDSPWPAGRAVQYSEHLPHFMNTADLAALYSGRAGIDARATLMRLVFIKSTDWAHEQEWRIFSGAGRHPEADHEDINFNAQELDAVIVGCKMPDAEQQAIAALLRDRYPHAALLKAVTRQRVYGLDVEPL